MRNDPAQIADVEFGVDLLVTGDLIFKGRQRERMVLVSPARLRDEALRLEPDFPGPIPGRGRLSDAAGHHHVGAEERELVLQAFTQLGKRLVVLVVQEVGLEPDVCPALAVKLQPGIVHAEKDRRRPAPDWA